jgi:hypothetical protein
MNEKHSHGIAFPCERGDAGQVMSGRRISTTELMTNRVRGVIHSCQVGLTRAGVRLRVGERTDLRIRWPISQTDNQCLRIGGCVVATIPVDAVCLEAGIFRRSKQRWNRWIGRIVLVESGEAGILYTVKIHGEDWTLKGYGPVAGAREPGKVWDVVNVVVDPQRVDLTIVDMRSWHQEADLMLGLKEF